MPAENILSTIYQNSFQLKAVFSSFTLFCLLHDNLVLLEHQLAEKIKLTPQFFQHMPVVIDLEKIMSKEINFHRLKEILLHYQLIPIGIKNGSEAQIQAAALVQLPLLRIGKPTANNTKTSEADTLKESKIISQPVRSGMQIYAKNADLIVTASVSPGAEIMADGNIHVYGSLRGRAMAGMQGNKQARIFCLALDAELVSIAGHYLSKEEKLTFKTTNTLQIYLEHEQIKISEL